MYYPKIETLYNRDLKTHKVTAQVRLPEFYMIDRWLVTEKIDGTNVRIEINSDTTVEGIRRRVSYHGRTDRAQMPTTLVNWLHEHIPAAKVLDTFDDNTKVTIFGEGYGAGIQKGGNYRSDISFRLFDVVVDDGDWRWWLSWDNIADIAKKLEVSTVPVLAVNVPISIATTYVQGRSEVSMTEHSTKHQTLHQREGIVVRTEPVLLQRNGQRVIWKLKGKDF